MNRAYLLTGGNMGDRKKNLDEALRLIGANCGEVLRYSSIYETAAWGNRDQASFLNQVLEVDTLLSARQLMRRILKVEKQMGRVRLEKYGPRIIDIDILLFNDEIHQYPLLRLPHPELPNRRFALAPLAELVPDLVHPQLKVTIKKLLDECRDDLPVRSYM